MCVGFKCSLDMINKARKMAAVNLILQIMTAAANVNKAEKRKYDLELQMMQREEELLIHSDQPKTLPSQKMRKKELHNGKKLGLKPMLLRNILMKRKINVKLRKKPKLD